MTFTVLSYSEKEIAHRCRLEDGRELIVDFFVDDGFSDQDPNGVIGKTFQCREISQDPVAGAYVAYFASPID